MPFPARSAHVHVCLRRLLRHTFPAALQVAEFSRCHFSQLRSARFDGNPRNQHAHTNTRTHTNTRGRASFTWPPGEQKVNTSFCKSACREGRKSESGRKERTAHLCRSGGGAQVKYGETGSGRSEGGGARPKRRRRRGGGGEMWECAGSNG